MVGVGIADKLCRMHAGFDPVGLVASHPGVVGLARALAAGGRAVASGVGGSAATLTAGAVSRLAGRPVVLVAAHIDDADEAADELAGAGVRALVLPALETLPGESHVSVELLAQRLAVVRAMGEPLVAPLVIVAPIQGLMQLVPAPSRLGRLARTLCADENVQPGELARWLTEAGYQRVEAVEEPGEFALRGGIMDIFPPGVGQATSLESEHSVGSPVRLDFFGDTIDRISEFDPGSMRADRVVKRVDLYAAETAKALADDAGVNFLELVSRGALALIAETMEVVEQGRGYFERVSDGRGVVGPPVVLRLVETRFHAVAELNQFSAGATSSEGRFDLDGGQLPVLARDACEALKELSEGAHGERVAVRCRTRASGSGWESWSSRPGARGGWSGRCITCTVGLRGARATKSRRVWRWCPITSWWGGSRCAGVRRGCAVGVRPTGFWIFRLAITWCTPTTGSRGFCRWGR